MKAIQISKTGDTGVMEFTDVPKPLPGAGEALVHLKTAGLNFIDIYIRKGLYQFPLPMILGMEGAGVVEDIGEGVRGSLNASG